MAKTLGERERRRNGQDIAASWLRELLLERKLTIKALAEQSGVSRCALSRILNRRGGSLQTLQKIAKAFNVIVPAVFAQMLPKHQDWGGLAQAHPVEFETFRNMHRRVSNPTHPDYRHYGAVGVNIHPRWDFTPEGFENFLADMGSRPSSVHSIHRSPPYANYGPNTCKWATPSEQTIEQRGKLVIEYNGRLMGRREFERVAVDDGFLVVLKRNTDGSLRHTRKRTRNGSPETGSCGQE